MNTQITMDEIISNVEKYRHQFYRFLKRSLWKKDSVEDVFSSAVLAALANRGSFTRGTNFRAWMFRILANKMFVANRDTSRTQSNVDTDSITLPDFQKEDDHKRLLDDPSDLLENCGDEVRRAFNRLTTAQKSCFLLRAVEHLTYKEIAQTLSMPVTTVMTHLARGRAKLREDLSDYAKHEGYLRRTTRSTTRSKAPQLAVVAS